MVFFGGRDACALGFFMVLGFFLVESLPVSFLSARMHSVDFFFFFLAKLSNFF